MRALKGGASCHQFLQLEWEFRVLPSELDCSNEDSCQVMMQLDGEREKNAEMHEELTRLRHQSDLEAQTMMQRMKAIKEDKTCASRGKRLNRSFDEYSESHKRRLKRARTSSCGDSLSWMEQEGYVPVITGTWNIKPTPEGTVGVQQPLQECLRVRVRHLLRVSKDDAPFSRIKSYV